jgi:hypothetical protein
MKDQEKKLNAKLLKDNKTLTEIRKMLEQKQTEMFGAEIAAKQRAIKDLEAEVRKAQIASVETEDKSKLVHSLRLFDELVADLRRIYSASEIMRLCRPTFPALV